MQDVIEGASDHCRGLAQDDEAGSGLGVALKDRLYLGIFRRIQFTVQIGDQMVVIEFTHPFYSLGDRHRSPGSPRGRPGRGRGDS